jgi:hypothetical protein
MHDTIEAIRAAVADGATAEQKAHGAAACRVVLAALGAEAGKPIAMPGAPAPHPLAGIDPGQALDLLIAKLTAALPKDNGKQAASTPPATDSRGLRIAFVAPPGGPRARRRASPQARRKP